MIIRGLLFSVLLVLAACKLAGSDESRILEGLDPSNLEAWSLPQFSYKEITNRKAREGFLSDKPWVSSYWPIYRNGLAFRYLDDVMIPKADDSNRRSYTFSTTETNNAKKFRSFDQQISTIEKFSTRPYRLSPAEKYDLIVEDKKYSLTNYEWAIKKNMLIDFQESEMKWMGICHGWALASYSEKPPLQHVMVKNQNGRELLFFEGDIRALLAKVYAHNDYETKTPELGDTCKLKARDLPTNNFGRVHDAAIIKEGSSPQVIRFIEQEGHPGFKKRGSRYRWTLFQSVALGNQKSNPPQPQYIVLDDVINERRSNNDYNKDIYPAWVFPDKESAFAAMTDWEGIRKPSSFKVQLFRPCRSINPSVFHSALMTHYSNAPYSSKKGFVTEIDRTYQVWNHPIWGFRSMISPLYEKKDLDEERQPFMANTATHFAEVATDLIYINEKIPLITYEDKKPLAIPYFEKVKRADGYRGNSRHDEESYKKLNYRYILEFKKGQDGNMKLIGGEWQESGEKGALSPMADTIWKERVAPSMADKFGQPSIIQYDLIKKIHACSTDLSLRKKSKTIYANKLDKNRSSYSTKWIKYVDCEVNSEVFHPQNIRKSFREWKKKNQ